MPGEDDGEFVHLDSDVMSAALDVAVRAPSIHITQPWRWRLAGDRLTLLADRTRQLPVIDPDGHSLLISCGAALDLTEIALRSARCPVRTTVLPDPSNPNLLATMFPTARDVQPQPQASEEVAAAPLHRRPFTSPSVSQEHRELLRHLGSDSHAGSISRTGRTGTSSWRSRSTGPTGPNATTRPNPKIEGDWASLGQAAGSRVTL